MTHNTSKSETFTIDFGKDDKPLRQPPKRFSEYSKKKELTLDELEKKQIEAKERRQKYEANSLTRIREKRDDCLKIDQKVWLLQQQDAKRKGLPGTECIKPMSQAEAKATIKSVVKDFSRITKHITTETKSPSP